MGRFKRPKRFGTVPRADEERQREAMNCDACRQHLLMTEDSETPALDVAGHLAECLACRDWQHQLTHIENNVRLLPVPASSPDAFIDKLLGNAPIASPAGAPNGDAANPSAS